jgi:hypothetical protein
MDAERLLKDSLLTSLGPDLRDALADPVSGTINVTSHDIFAHIVASYGTFLESDFSQLADDLTIPFDPSASSLELYILRLNSKLRQLEAAGQPKSPKDKFDILLRNTASTAALQPIIENYKFNHPVITTRTFAGLAQAFATFYPAYSSTSTPTTASSLFAASATQPSKNPAHPTKPTTTSPQPQKWCSSHGWGHGGSVCRNPHPAHDRAQTAPPDVASPLGLYRLQPITRKPNKPTPKPTA